MLFSEGSASGIEKIEQIKSAVKVIMVWSLHREHSVLLPQQHVWLL